MNSIPEKPAARLSNLQFDGPVALRLFEQEGAPTLRRVPLRPPDLSDILSEAWRDGCLRVGHPGLPLADTPMRLRPTLAKDSDTRCASFDIEVFLPDGRITRRTFPISSLRHVADRHAVDLLKSGVLSEDSSCLFELTVETDAALAPPPEPANATGVRSLRAPPLQFRRGSFRRCLQRARPVALLDDEEPAVFYTEESFARAEACARRGASDQVETGAALCGVLVACGESGEFFSVIQDVIPIEHAEQKKFSLSYSSATWMRLQQLLEERRTHSSPTTRLLGQAHLHPFSPGDGKRCDECAKRASCSSAWISPDDQRWHRSVFVRQPWAVCHIFGLTARSEPAHQLFGLRNGRLAARGFYVLPDLDGLFD